MKATDLAEKLKNLNDDTQGAALDAIINVNTSSVFETSELDLLGQSENLKKKSSRKNIFSEWFKVSNQVEAQMG